MTEGIKNNKITKYMYIFLNLCLICISILPNIVLREKSYSVTVSLGICVSIVYIILLLKNQNHKRVHMKKRYLLLYELIGILFILNSIIYETKAYFAVGIIFSLLIPAFHIALGNSNLHKIEEYISKAVIISFVIICIISLLCAPPLNNDQYKSFFVNSNTYGYFLVVVVACSLYEIRKRERNEAFIVILIASVCFCFFSNSRTSMIAIVMELAFYLCVSINDIVHDRTSKRVKAIIKRIAAIILLIVLTVASVFVLFTTVKHEMAKIFPEIQIEYSEDSITFDDSMKLGGARFSKGIGKDMVTFTSGRTDIWKEYAQNIHFLGHKEEEREIGYGNRYYESTNAHNVYLQMAYSAGIPAGIGMVILVICLIIDLVKRLISDIKKKNKFNNGICLLTYICLGFGVVSLTANIYMPYIYILSLYFWILQYKVTLR